MTESIQKLELSDGNDMPYVGVVAHRLDSNEDLKYYIQDALYRNIRHFEINELFGNGHLVMEALAESNVPREEIFITFKLWPKERTPDDLIEACKLAFEDSGLTYADLLLLHAPIENGDVLAQWKALESLVDDDIVRSLGITNVNATQLSEMMKYIEILPAVYQTEVTPFNTQQDLMELCDDSSIAVLCNEPLAKGIRNDNFEIKEVAVDAELSSEELLVRWACSKGYGVLIPPTNSVLQIDGGKLSEPLGDDIMERLNAFDEKLTTMWVPSVEEDA